MGPPAENAHAVEPVGRRDEHTVASERRYRPAVDFQDRAEHTQAWALLQAGFVQRPAAIDDPAFYPHDDVEGHPLLDARSHG